MKRIQLRTIRKTNRILASAITLFIILIIGIYFIFKVSTISFPKNRIEENVGGISDTIMVYKNHFGIPHIITKNEKDAYFATGYYHASDRLWQMDYMRRCATGTLSEVMGKDMINADKFMRCLNLRKIASQIWPSLDNNVKSALRSYSEGVNYYLTKQKNRLPFEFNALDFTPEKWKPEDCIVISRLYAFSNSSSFSTDLALGEIAEKIGVNRALELLPSYPSNIPYILDDSVSRKLQVQKKADSANKSAFLPASTNDVLISTLNFLNDVKNNLKISFSAGSNAWAVKKVKSSGSGVILANDPHSFLTIPSLWCQMHVSCPSFNVIGVTIPGIPFFFSGRNDYIGWGFTNLMVDDWDYFFEKTDSTNNNYYWNHKGQKVKFKYIADTIRVKNSQTVLFYTKYTERSAVISDFSTFSFPDDLLNVTAKTNKLPMKYCLTYSWTGLKPSLEMNSFYYLNKAKDWNQFKRAINYWSVPGSNFIYSDTRGNLGAAPAGIVPVRKLCNPHLPNPGWLPDYDWEGYKTSADMPVLLNPRKNFVASANNPLAQNFPTFITSYWEPSSRAERISDLLTTSTEYTTRDAQIMQMDMFSPYAAQLLGYALPEMEKLLKDMTQPEKTAFYKLKYWDFILNPLSLTPAIYEMFYNKLIYYTFYDELGENLFRQYCTSPALPSRKIMQLMQDTTGNHWFDDVRTPQKEYRNYILLKSLRDAVNYLAEYFDDTDMNKWKYGKIHNLTLNHSFTNNKFLRPAVNVGKYEIGGDYTTINKSESKLYNPVEVQIGPGMRLVADMEDSVVFCSIPGGASGEPLNPNYSDQIQLWLNGGYVQMPIANTPGAGFSLWVLFKPE